MFRKVCFDEDYQCSTTDEKETDGIGEGATLTVYDVAAHIADSVWRFHDGEWHKL